MCKRHDGIGGFGVVGDLSSLDDSETFLSIFVKELIFKDMLALRIAPHLVKVVHVQLPDKRGVIGVFVVLGEDDFAEFGDVEDDKTLFV